MTMSIVTLKSGETFTAYVARPTAAGPHPVVVVIQEIFGVNDGIRGKCDWLAREGFIAVAPDLFWRLEKGVELTDKTKAEWDKALDLMNRFDIDAGIEDIKATMEQFRQDPDSNGYAGCIGYCLGGKLAYLAAARTKSDASAGYYAIGLETLLAEANRIENPLLLHIAGQDKFSSDEARAKITHDLAANPHIAMHVYEGQDHAFTRVGGEHYDEKAAAEADHHTVLFLKKNLHDPAFVRKAS